MATVRRTSQDFHYQLVITRVYEEGEEALLDEEDESKPCLSPCDIDLALTTL